IGSQRIATIITRFRVRPHWERALRLVAVEACKPTYHDEHYKIPGTTPLGKTPLERAPRLVAVDD
ncbi:hypothetical protein JW905_00295, partial [bacterium]|nr:hypothetical protein [candidate division CSSED10-310 bacterium]